MEFQPYLFFGGNCREAFERYHEIFGGEKQIVTMADAPGDTPPGQEDVVIHAALMFDDGRILMGSDDPISEDFGPVHGMMISYDTGHDVDEVTRVFDLLADGGEVTAPVEETFFSPAFGMLIDRFGTPWMVSARRPEDP